ncbi:hypothetical protein HPP92_027993 [Vanilla planifolia]|uniref:Bulb-type lectin domain-containing protein n=1 Tax=Vanilla planifolia TaxID=51239 RepID=A0A835PAD7_VANPL|nr:hypothetical protein HPP92_027993 [Vanilla planifolia]
MGIQRSLLLLWVMALCWSSSTAYNVLFTGETLANQSSIGFPEKGSFVMQLDCNLVLYNENGVPLFHTNTAGFGRRNCILSFTNNGRLVVRTPAGRTLWQSPNFNSPIGDYAAVFRPDGDVAIYGPVVWSSFARGESMETAQKQQQQPEATGEVQELLGNRPMYNNMLFSGQILSGNRSIKDLSSLEVTNDCQLLLTVESGLRIVLGGLKGEDCFARLNFRGQLTLLDDTYAHKLAWPTTANPTRGEYVLILRGSAALIYGPLAWSTNVRGVPNPQAIVNLMLPSDAKK